MGEDGGTGKGVDWSERYREFNMKIIHRSEISHGLNRNIIDPREYGINDKSRVCIYNKVEKKYIHLIALDSNQVLQFSIEDCGPEITCRLDVIEQGRWKKEINHFPLIPDEFRGVLPEKTVMSLGDLQFTTRQNVTIGKYETLPNNGRPDGIRAVYSGDSFVAESLRFTLGRQTDIPGCKPIANKIDDRTVIFADLQNPSFGHFITESISRLWYAKVNPDLPIVWLGSKPLQDYQKGILKLLGLQNEQTYIDETTCFREVVFPFPGVAIGNYFDKQQAKFMGFYDSSNESLRNDNLETSDKIFLSRSALSGERGKSSLDIQMDQLMADAGFLIFYPEKHSLNEQLQAISDASVVAGVESSALHLPLFLKDQVKTRFVAIARHRRGSGIFQHIKKVKNLNYETYDFTLEQSKLRTARDPLEVDLQILANALTHTKGFEQDFESLEKYHCKPNVIEDSYRALLSRSRVVPYKGEIKFAD